MSLIHKLRPLLMIALCLLGTRLASADGIRLTNDTGSSTSPYICSLGNGTGNLSVVWVDNRMGTDRIFFTRVSSVGAKLQSDSAVSDGAAAASSPTCAVDSAGATYIVWKQAGALMYAKLNSSGTVLVQPFAKISAPIDSPHLDVEPGGDGHLVWVDATAPRRVKYRKLNSSGGNFPGCNEIIYDTTNYANTTEYPFILAPGSGNTYAFLSWHGDDVGYEHLLDVALPYPSCNDVNGAYWQTNDLPVGRTAMIENQVAENVWLVFEGHTDTPVQHVYWEYGAGIYGQLDQGIGPASYPSISSLTDSQVFTVWEDRRYGTPWIFGRAANGTANSLVGDNCVISSGQSAARRPTMTRAGAATFAVVWDDNRHGPEEIYLAITGPSCSGFEVVDPNPDLAHAGAVVTDPTTLANTPGRPVSGLAADGVTPVLLRLPVTGSGTVTFDIFNELGGSTDVGVLRTPGGSENAITLTVPTNSVGGKFWAFAILVAPDRFVRSSADESIPSRTVRVRTTFHPSAGPPVIVERTLDIKRPPVLLLHGLWGKASGWGWTLMNDPRFLVYAHDYWQTNAAPFATNVREARRAVAGALEKIRDTGIAATQVDAFGHSMGGLLLRKYRSSDFYFSDASLRAGDLHTLVTVDSPHKGSEWANVLLSATLLHPLMANLGYCVTCGAVNDLRPNSSEITSMPATLVPSHAFIGKGGSDMIQAALESQVPRELRAMLVAARFFGIIPQDLFPPGLQHDLIVGRISQEGGLTTGSSQTSVFGFVSVNPLNLGVHMYSVTRESQVNDRAVQTLNTPATNATTYAAGFPAASFLTIPGAPVKWNIPRQVLSGGIAITSPSNGATVTPGMPLQVTVTPVGGFVPARVLVTGTYDSSEVDSSPFTATLTVPEEAIGDIAIRAAAYSSSNEYATASEVHVSVVVPATLTSIATSPSSVYLFSRPDTLALNVVGHYSDGVDRRISAGTLGTTYRSSDESVVAVDSDGMMTSRKEGLAVVYVANGALTATAVVQVKPLPVLLQVDRDAIKWPAVANATGYDVVRGDLPLLRGTLGTYEIAIAECLANDLAATSLTYNALPDPGWSFFFLERAVRPGGPGSYDGYEYGAIRQVGSRDAGIAAASGACP